jgi:hypothetical protein
MSEKDFVSIVEYEAYVEQLKLDKESYLTKVIKGTRRSPRRIRVIRLPQKSMAPNGTD